MHPPFKNSTTRIAIIAGAGDCELNNLQLTTAIEAEGFRECDQDMDLALSWAEMSACIVSWILNHEN